MKFGLAISGGIAIGIASLTTFLFVFVMNVPVPDGLDASAVGVFGDAGRSRRLKTDLSL